jgi:4'-phosphopantetheinyl transferase
LEPNAYDTLNHSWQSPLDKIRLSKGDVHVWIAEVDNPVLSEQDFLGILSDEEHKKAERFFFDQDKRRYIVCHGVLRTIIGKYHLGIEPGRLEFWYGPRGKPFLADKFSDGTLQFNQSYSKGLALYAFTKGREIGIDLEYIRFLPNARQIVAGSFSKLEQAAFNALPEREKKEAFFNCWTRKEAFIKAIGEGLYYPLDQFDVSLSPGEYPRLLRVAGMPGEASLWSLKSFTPAIEYKAALAIKCKDYNIIYWRFPVI